MTDHKLSVFFKELQALCEQKEGLLFRELVDKISVRGHSVLIFFLALPFITPAPTFGLSAVFGVAICYVSIQMIFNKKPWLPEKLVSKPVPREGFKKIFEFIVKILEKLEYLVKPRWPSVFANKTIKFAVGLEIALLGILLALPLPPGTNAPPAVGIAIISLAYSEEDGLLLSLGQILFLFNLFFFGALAYFGFEGSMFLFKKLHPFLY